MRVELKTLTDNPMRDFTVDPIDADRVLALKASIKEDGFWGGIVCRGSKRNGIEIAAGHHRVRAAIAAGIREADLFVGDLDDSAMIRIYARENATQRGNAGTALAGSVAAAIRFLAKAIMTGVGYEDFFTSSDLAENRGNLTSDRGLGRQVIVRFLDGVPGINDGTVQQQLANLKTSGDYARIVREVQQEIEEENKEALKALAKAEAEKARAEEAQRKAEAAQKEAEERRKEAARAAKTAKDEADARRAEADAKRAELAKQKADEEAKLAAKRKAEADEQMKDFDELRTTRDTANNAADKAEEREKTFDFEGVAKHLRNASHIDVFRQLVTGAGIKPYLPVNKQASLAKQIVALAGDGELSARFIRENLMSLVMNVKGTERKYSAEEKAEMARKDWTAKMRMYQEEASRNARGFLTSAVNISDQAKKRPNGVTLLVTSEFRDAIDKIDRAVALIRKAGVK